MKNGTLRFIPLQADLCLNKQKVDIEDFKGWQKCNAPVYGGCLSPLYKKVDTHHDIFIGNDTYDFEGGKLYKNGVEVLSGYGSKKLKKTKINQNYKTLCVTSDNVLTWAKELSGVSFSYSLHGGETQNVTLQSCRSIIDIKAFGKSEYNTYGITALYLSTTGNIGYYVVWEENGTRHISYGAGSPTLWSNFDIQAPLIQVGVYDEGEFLISFFSNSGADVRGVQIKNVVIKGGEVYETVIFKDENQHADRYKTLDDGTDVKISVENLYGEGSGNTLAYSQIGRVCQQTITITLGKPLSYPLTIVPKYLNANGEYVQANNGESFTIPAGDISYKRIVRWAAKMKINVVGPATQKEEQLSVLINEGQWVSKSITTSNPQIYGGYVAQVGGELKSSLVFDVTFTSDENPNDPVIPENLVSTTIRIGENVAQTDNGYESEGLVISGLYKEWTTYNAGPDMQLATLVDGIMSGRTSTAPVASGYFYGIVPYGQQYDYSHYWDTYAFNPYLNSGKYPLPANGNNWYMVDTFYAMERFIKEQYSAEVLANVDCCMDNGLLFNASGLPLSEGDQVPLQLFALSGTYEGYDEETNILSYNSTSLFNIAYNASEASNVYPRYYMGMKLSLSNYILRSVFKFKAKKDSEDFIYVMVDSIRAEVGDKAAYLFPGVTESGQNLQGGAKNTTNTSGWRFLFNNNLLSNISCYEDKDYIGTILADWFTIDESFCPTYNNNVLYYKDSSANIWKIEMVNSGEEWEYKYIENRYIVLNTTNYFNCYDTQTGLKRHWASDYNNRVVYGFGFTTFYFDEQMRKLLTSDLYNGFIITGQNANYEETKDMITGLELGAIRYISCLADYQNFVYCNTPYGAVESIDLYKGEEDSTSAIYLKSFINGMNFINTDLTNPDAVYPISVNGDIRFNPNLFSQFIASYNNKDMVISDGIAYKLAYYNNVIPVMAYYLLDGVESLENAFVLQTSYYGVAKTRLYQMNYSNGVGVEVVCDITNLEYLGALPSQALFWSAQNRAIYSFQGNCIMHLTQYANELTGIFGKWYNPATQELFLDTNIGILVFSDLGTYCLEWDNETNVESVRDIFFFEDYFIINFIADVTKSYYYSYNNKTGYESNKVYFITKYYGNGLVPITVNNIYIRLYDQAVENAEGFIKMKGYTITDKGTETDTKEVLIGGEDNPEATPPTVAGEAWDSETGTMLVKYTPQYNRGLGFALEVETTFPIIDIKFDYIENGSVESQIAHVNI